MSWGKIYCDTNWGENKYRTAGSIINEATPDCFQFPEFVSFKDHVRSEGATYEKMQCGIDILLFLGRSISITPQSPDNPTFSGILDTYTGATAGYSTRRLTNTYTGGLIRVRRSSDDTEQDIGYDANGEDLDIFGLLAFVNENVDTYTSDFSSTEDIGESNGTGAAAQSIGGVDDAYKFTLSGGVVQHYAQTPNNSVATGFNVSVSFDYYIPSGQGFDRINVRTDDNGDGTTNNATTLGSWDTFTWDISNALGSKLRLRPATASSISVGDDGNVFYLKNIVITQTTADGHVTTWYDQTGNGNHATNSTASEQSKIVDGGSIIYEGATISRPAIEFDGVNDDLTFADTGTMANGCSSFQVLAADDAAQDSVAFYKVVDANNTLSMGLRSNVIGARFRVGGGEVTQGGTSSTNQVLFAQTSSSSPRTMTATLDGVVVTSAASIRLSGVGSSIGSRRGNDYNYDGTMQEIVFFESDQSANRTGIEGNINNYFSIYTP